MLVFAIGAFKEHNVEVTCLLWHSSIKDALPLLQQLILLAHGQMELSTQNARHVQHLGEHHHICISSTLYLLVFSHSGILLLALDLIAEFKSLPLWPIAGVPYGAPN